MITIKDITGKSIEVTDLNAAIKQLEEFCEIPCPFKISGTQHTVGEDHAYCLAQLKTLKQQQRRNNWLPTTKNRYEQGKRFTKEDMAYEIGRFEASHPAHIYWDKLKREDIIHSFNTLFGTTIK